jgi:flagellar biosynthetic protein FliP
MLLSYQQEYGSQASVPPYYEDVPLSVLLPAYLLSELKTAFVIGIQIVLPFLVIDLVVASILPGMGLMMLPPVLVSLPFKLLLFVLIDGWALTVEMLLRSVPMT